MFAKAAGGVNGARLPGAAIGAMVGGPVGEGLMDRRRKAASLGGAAAAIAGGASVLVSTHQISPQSSGRDFVAGAAFGVLIGLALVLIGLAAAQVRRP